MSLLTVVQNTCRLTGLRVPTEVVNSTDTQVQQLFALANEVLVDLARAHTWQILTRQQTFTTVAAEEQPDALPDDFDYELNNTVYNRTTRLTLIGPITPQLWQAIKAQPQLNRVYLCWRERDGAILITPEPPAGQEIAYEYVTSNFAETSTGTPIPEYAADSDVAVLPERLVQLSLRWRFLSAKNLDYAEAFRSYQTQLQIQQARDGGMTQLNMTGSTTWGLWGFPNLPLGNFPG